MLEPQNERFVRDFLNCSHFVATNRRFPMSFLMNSKIYDLEIDVWREASANPQSETGTLATHSGKKTNEYNKNMGSCKCSLKKQSFDPYSTHHRFPPPAAAGRPRYRLGELRNWSWVLFTHPIWLILIVNTNIKTNLGIEPTTKYPSNWWEWWDPRKKME